MLISNWIEAVQLFYWAWSRFNGRENKDITKSKLNGINVKVEMAGKTLNIGILAMIEFPGSIAYNS